MISGTASVDFKYCTITIEVRQARLCIDEVGQLPTAISRRSAERAGGLRPEVSQLWKRKAEAFLFTVVNGA